MKMSKGYSRRKTAVKTLFGFLIILDVVAVFHFASDLACTENKSYEVQTNGTVQKISTNSRFKDTLT